MHGNNTTSDSFSIKSDSNHILKLAFAKNSFANKAMTVHQYRNAAISVLKFLIPTARPDQLRVVQQNGTAVHH